MDTFLVDYIKSGNAWLFVGSGPSVAMGYPSWRQLASHTIDLLRRESSKSNLQKAEKAFQSSDYSGVFEEAFNALVPDHVLSTLRQKLIPSRPNVKIYDILSKWPISVYLTTNYDDALQSHLTTIGETYIPYTNSPDHMAFLNSSLTNAIVKVHGDLRSQKGLVLTKSQYRAIQNDLNWKYWRDSMAAVFRMQPIIMIGFSLKDPHIKQILQTVKESAGVHQPVCWIAPDIDFQAAQDFLVNFRIRVISYDNRDGTHANLTRLIDNISQFVFSRTSQKIRKEIAEAVQSPLGQRASAPGFFVFNKIAAQDNFETYRVNIVCAAIRAVIPALSAMKDFDLQHALSLAGWPKEYQLEKNFADKVIEECLRQGIFIRLDVKFSIDVNALNKSQEESMQYEHIRRLFIDSLKNRIRRQYPDLPIVQVSDISENVDKSLVGFFRECGLALSTTLIDRSNKSAHSPIPSSVIRFINQAASIYDSILLRQVFSTCAVDIFTQPEKADKEYLGRISQGFFAFHALGLFGEAAKERLEQARYTVWLIDSNLQIPALALAAPTNAVFRECFARIKELGIRLFTTEKLFGETLVHLYFAQDVIRKEGDKSDMVIAAATGQAPYRKANQFLEGFIRWRAAGNPNDWSAYMLRTFNSSKPTANDVRIKLEELGVETYELKEWPGFNDNDMLLRNDYETEIVSVWERKIQSSNDPDHDPDIMADFHKKAEPEADALVVVTKERSGEYHMVSEPKQQSSAWFVSHTSMLNVVGHAQTRITWQPEAFLRFASTLAPATSTQDANRAFDMLLLSFTQLGVGLLDEKSLLSTFGGVIDDSNLRAQELTQQYEELLSDKYSESPENVIRRLKPLQRPAAIRQLESELLNVQTQRVKQYESIVTTTTSRAAKAERELGKFEKIKQKMEEKRRLQKRKSRQKKSKKK